MSSLFSGARVVGVFLGFSEGGLEFHADLVLPYDNTFQYSAIHGQFVLAALEDENEAILGRITTVASQGRLVTPSGEDYAVRAVQESRPIPEDMRRQYLKYRVDIRILGVLHAQQGDKTPLFVASHRRVPHVGAKVAFPSPELLRFIAGANTTGETVADIGFLAFGEFVHAASDDARAGEDPRIRRVEPSIVARFDVEQMVSRRTFVFARAGFGKSNLIKLLFADLYGLKDPPTVQKRFGRKPVGTVIFDPDGEYYWPDDKGRPGLCDVPELHDRLVVFTDKEGPSAFYESFVVGRVHLDIRELEASKVVAIVLPADRQDQQNVQKLRALNHEKWSRLVDAVWDHRIETDLKIFYEILGLKPKDQEAEALAARGNMVRIVNSLHNPSSRLLSGLKSALSEGKLCVVDISRMRGPQGLALAGVLLQDLFDHNQSEFTKRDSKSIPTIAVIEEAQSVLSSRVSNGEGPFVAWVKEGRKYDLGAVLVTQQPGSLPEELLSQGDNWFLFHLLASGDLRAAKNANAHFSDDLLATLLNEPLVGHGVFWSSAGDTPYPIPIRTLSFEDAYQAMDPAYNQVALDNYATKLKLRQRRAIAEARAKVGTASALSSGVTGGEEGTADPADLIARAAIQHLRESDFEDQVRSRGIPWGGAQKILSKGISSDAVLTPFEWVRQRNLVRRGCDEILGQGNWVTEKRPTSRYPDTPKVWIMLRQDETGTVSEDDRKTTSLPGFGDEPF